MTMTSFKEWTVDFGGRVIKVTNSFDAEMSTSADLYLDEVHLDQCTKKVANPHKPVLSKVKVAEGIDSIEVYASGVLKPKVSILVNGEVVLADKLSWLDRFANSFFPKR